MTEAASGAMGGASMQRLASGYDVANRFIKTNSAKGRVISATSDGVDNIKPVGMLSAQGKKLSGAAGVAVELNSVKKDAIASMNKLPREVMFRLQTKFANRYAAAIGRLIAMRQITRLKK